jgi:hypothetical protein
VGPHPESTVPVVGVLVHADLVIQKLLAQGFGFSRAR